MTIFLYQKVVKTRLSKKVDMFDDIFREHVTMNEVDPPPPFWYAVFSGGVRRYAVRRGSVRSMEKSCYIVRSDYFSH